MGDVNLTEGQDLIGQEISTRASQIAHFAELSTGAGETTFKVNNQGLFMGASNYGDAPFKVDYSGNMTAANAEFPGGTVTGGQTAYNTGTGFWMGLDGTIYKFSIGNGSTKYLTWDGTALTIRGTLNADDITAGTLTGRTVQTASSGSRILMTSGNVLEFREDSTLRGSMYTNTSGNKGIIIKLGSGNELKIDDSDDDTVVAFNKSGSNRRIEFYNNKTLYTNTDGDRIWIDANLVPAVNGGSSGDSSLGNTNYKFKEIWVNTVHSDDTVFHDKECPLCHQEFQVGDKMVNYIYAKEEDGGNRTVPAHISCKLKKTYA